MRPLENIQLKNSPWFKEWFDSQYYHSLYRNRSEAEAADFVDALVYLLQPAESSTMIDVGCGAGRHCRKLASYGYDVWGIDLSGYSIRQAKKYESANLHFFQRDMRKPFGKHYFDYVFNFFTSFGYFETLEEHHQVLKNMSDVLKPGGKLIMDYINVNHAANSLRQFEKKEIDGIMYDIERWVDDRYFLKRINIHDESGERIEHTEKVARFDLDDFRKMFSSCGLAIDEVYGDYKLGQYEPDQSPRLIMDIRKA